MASARIGGLDTVRFVCALWVLIGHTGLLPLPGGAERAFASAFNGPAAVIVFFVVSGLCIHYPFRQGGRMWLPGFYGRRYLRLAPPVMAAVALGASVGYPYSLFEGSILWSLVCEGIYYALYPLLMWVARRAGWLTLLSVAYAGSAAVILSDPAARDYPSFGIELNWLLGLPCWLLGCFLAERIDTIEQRPLSRPAIWAYRLSVWLVSWVALLTRFHGPLGYPLTLTLFAVLVYFWLRREVAYMNAHRPPAPLEWAGRWSYSLYLMHRPLMVLIAGLQPDLGPALNWIVMVAGVFIGTYALYLLVEWPSHLIARLIPMRPATPVADPAPVVATPA